MFRTHGAENPPSLLRRAVLLDVAAEHGVPTLEQGYGVTADDTVQTT